MKSAWCNAIPVYNNCANLAYHRKPQIYLCKRNVIILIHVSAPQRDPGLALSFSPHFPPTFRGNESVDLSVLLTPVGVAVVVILFHQQHRQQKTEHKAGLVMRDDRGWQESHSFLINRVHHPIRKEKCEGLVLTFKSIYVVKYWSWFMCSCLGWLQQWVHWSWILVVFSSFSRGIIGFFI